MPEDIPTHHFDFDYFGVSFPFMMSDYSHPEAREPRPHRHDFFEIHYLTGGKGKHIIDFEAYAIAPYNLYFISPGQVHFWELEQPLQGHALLFTEDFLLQGTDKARFVHALSFFHSVEKAPMLQLATRHHSRLDILVQTIVQEFRQPQFGQASVLRAYLHILLVEAQRHYAAPQSDREIQRYMQTRQFKQLVANHFLEERSVEAYASMLKLSSGHLHEIIKSVTGLTPGQLIRNEIILEAKRLLTHTQLGSAQVGYRLEFDDPAYFSRFFKREVGLTPRQFQQATREKYHLG